MNMALRWKEEVHEGSKLDRLVEDAEVHSSVRRIAIDAVQRTTCRVAVMAIAMTVMR